MSDHENVDDFSSEIAEGNILGSDDQINTTLETSTPDRQKKSSKRLSGFTGAPVDGNGIMIQELQTLLKTIKNEAKVKGDAYQRIKGENPDLRKKNSARSLFGSTYTPEITGNNDISELEMKARSYLGGVPMLQHL